MFARCRYVAYSDMFLKEISHQLENKIHLALILFYATKQTNYQRIFQRRDVTVFTNVAIV